MPKSEPKEPVAQCSEDPAIDWIEAIDAVYLISNHYGGDDRAKAQLLSRLQDGSLSCRATYWGQEADVGKLETSDLEWGGHRQTQPHNGQIDKTFCMKPKLRETHVEVPADILLKSDGWLVATDEAIWVDGFIIARRNARFRQLQSNNTNANRGIRRFVYGLEFRRSEIESQLMDAVRGQSLVTGPH